MPLPKDPAKIEDYKRRMSEAKKGIPKSTETRAKISASGKGKIISMEQRTKISAALKGERNPNFGKALSPEHRAKISAGNKGKSRSIDTRNKISATKKGTICGEKHPMFGKHHSKESRNKMSAAKIGKLVGIKNHLWKGGITPLAKIIRKSLECRSWRLEVFERDLFTCQVCGSTGVYLEAHHIKNFAQILEENNIKTFDEARNCAELWDVNNGIALCKKCHLNIRKTSGIPDVLTEDQNLKGGSK